MNFLKDPSIHWVVRRPFSSFLLYANCTEYVVYKTKINARTSDTTELEHIEILQFANNNKSVYHDDNLFHYPKQFVVRSCSNVNTPPPLH